MNFQEAIKSGFNRMTDYRGRSSLSEYWWFSLFSFIVLTLLEVCLWAGMGSGGLVLVILVELFLGFGPGLSLLVRRLHDTNKSGWFVLIIFVPIVGSFIVLVFTLLPSDISDNEYGPNPLS